MRRTDSAGRGGNNGRARRWDALKGAVCLMAGLGLSSGLAAGFGACGGDQPTAEPADVADAADAADAPHGIDAAHGADGTQLDVGGPNTDADTAADAAGPPSAVFAYRAETWDEIPDGPAAQGQPGFAYVLGNDLVRFTIQGASPAGDKSVGLNVFGGDLIDADLVRAPGEPGQDRFRESFPIVGFKVLHPSDVHVLADGSDGAAAIVRVEGTLGPSKILDMLDTLADDTDAQVALEYEVRPHEPFLHIRTLVTNPTAKPLSVLVGDFLSFGGFLRLFVPNEGFGYGSDMTDGFLATRGQRVSYGYGVEAGDFQAPFVETSGTAGILNYDLPVAPGHTETLERLFAVGDGSISSVVDAFLAVRGEPHGRLAGVVRDAAGAPVAGAFVTALVAGGGEAMNQAVTGDDGAWHMLVRPGSYELVGHGLDRDRSQPLVVDVADGDDLAVDLDGDYAIGDVAVVKLALTGDGPMPATGAFPAVVALDAVDAQEPDKRLGERSLHGQTRVDYTAGQDTLRVKPGRYDITLSHGPLFERVERKDVLLTDGATLDGHLAQVIQTPGWIPGDFHQHTVGSLDSHESFVDQVKENLSQGLQCAAVTDHDNVTDLSPQVTLLQARACYLPIIGDEVSVNGVGHFNAFPLPLDPADPFALAGVKLWVDRTIQDLFAQLHALPTNPSVFINHPRSPDIKGYFTTLKWEPWSGTAGKGSLAQDFDALEVNTELGQATDFTPEGWARWAAGDATVPTLADWFGFLNRGKDVCGVGDSDAHDRGDDAGYPRTYLRVGHNDPAALTEQQVTQALAAQHAVVSRGAWLSVSVGDQHPMGHDEVVDGAGGVTFHVVAQVPPWLSLDTVEVYANGLLVDSRPALAPAADAADPTVWFDDDFTFTAPAQDTWYVFVTRGSSSGQPVFSGWPFAFTNPVYVDVDGGGFTAPGPVVLPQ